MKSTPHFNIYECLDPEGEQVKYVCDGHIDSNTFRDKCYQDYYIKPLVITHQWQALRRSPARKQGKRFLKGITTTVPCNPWEKGAQPVTVGFCQR